MRASAFVYDSTSCTDRRKGAVLSSLGAICEIGKISDGEDG